MKDSFESFKDADINQWVINFRGYYKNDAIQYIKDRLGEKLISFQLESKEGWFFDSRQLIKEIKSDYIFFWIEDHICTCGAQQFNAVISEMKRLNVDYLGYSWFGMGLFLNQFRSLNGTEGKSLKLYNYTKKFNQLRQENSLTEIGVKSYYISVCGVFKRDLFNKIINSSHPFLRRWPKQTPFDFEKRWDDTYFLPLQYGVLKFEMFVPIDDNNVYPDSSLISRGLYPERFTREEMVNIREGKANSNTFFGLRYFFRKFLIFKIFYLFLKRISYHL